MNLKRFFKALLMLSAAAGLVWIAAGCEYTDSNPIWNPNADLGVFPAIKAMNPANRAVAGVMEIAIKGQGFSNTASKNTVYFGTLIANIKTCADTQIVVYRPNTSGDSMTVKVMVDDALTIATLKNYGVAEVAGLYGNMPGKNFSQFVAVDNNDKVYFLAPNKNVSIIDPSNQASAVFGKRSFSPKATDMRLGPDGGIYFAYNNAALHQIAPAGGNSAKLVDMPAAFTTLDFASSGIMYAAGSKTGLMTMAADLSTKKLSECDDLTVTFLAVFKNAVYVTDGGKIYRCAITGADGSVAGKEVVFDLTANATYGASKIVSFALADDGSMYVSVSHEHALIVVKADGSVAPVYLGILAPAGGQLAWGGGNFFYLNMNQNTGINDLERITMGTKTAGK